LEATLSQRVSISLKILIKFRKWSGLSGGGGCGGMTENFAVHFHLARAQGFIDFANSSDRRNCFSPSLRTATPISFAFTELQICH